MLTLTNVRVEVASYGRRSLREAGERLLARLEALFNEPSDSAEITRAQLAEIAQAVTDPQEILVIGDLSRLGNLEVWPRPAALTVNDTPVFERTKRISDMIARTLDEGAPDQR